MTNVDAREPRFEPIELVALGIRPRSTVIRKL